MVASESSISGATDTREQGLHAIRRAPRALEKSLSKSEYNDVTYRCIDVISINFFPFRLSYVDYEGMSLRKAQKKRRIVISCARITKNSENEISFFFQIV